MAGTIPSPHGPMGLLHRIDDAIRAKPFRPLVVRMEDGRAFPIHHAGQVILGLRGAISLPVLLDDKAGNLGPRRVASIEPLKGA